MHLTLKPNAQELEYGFCHKSKRFRLFCIKELMLRKAREEASSVKADTRARACAGAEIKSQIGRSEDAEPKAKEGALTLNKNRLCPLQNYNPSFPKSL